METIVKKYGAKVSDKTRESARGRVGKLNEKGKETLLKNHGVTNPGQIENHREKCKATLLKNYEVDNYYKSSEFKEKMKCDQLVQ